MVLNLNRIFSSINFLHGTQSRQWLQLHVERNRGFVLERNPESSKP